MLKHLLKTNREVSKMLSSEAEKTREDVTDVMKDKWKRQREREKELEGDYLFNKNKNHISALTLIAHHYSILNDP